MLETFDGVDALLFGTVECEDGGAEETLDGGDPTEEGELLVEEEVGEETGYDDREGTHGSLELGVCELECGRWSRKGGRGTYDDDGFDEGVGCKVAEFT